MTIAIDFDGTIVSNAYPDIGQDLGAIPVIKELMAQGHKLILWTMRTGKDLENAVGYLVDKEIKLWGVNKNPGQFAWSNSPKVYAHLYIDDGSAGIPMVTVNNKRAVDWVKLREWLVTNGYITHVNN